MEAVEQYPLCITNLHKSKMKQEVINNAYEACPRFDCCNLNVCPLHPDYSKLWSLESDPSSKNRERCIEKSVRKRIGLKFGLVNMGLTSCELSGKRRWDNLTPEQQEAKRQNARKMGFVSASGKKLCQTLPQPNPTIPNPTKGDIELKTRNLGIAQETTSLK